MAQIYLINQSTLKGYEDISPNVKPDRILNIVKRMQELDLKLFLGHPLYYDFMQYASNSAFDVAVISNPNTTAIDGNYINRPLIAMSGSGNNAFGSFIVVNGKVTSFVKVSGGVDYEVGDSFTCASVPGAVFEVTSLNVNVAFASDTPQHYLDLFNGSVYTDNQGNEIIYEGLIPALVYFTFARFIESDAYRYTATGPVVKDHDNSQQFTPAQLTKLVQQNRSVANAHCNEVTKFLYDNQKDFPLWRYNGKKETARQAGPRIRGIDRTNFNGPNGSRYGYGYDFFDINGTL